MSADATKTSPAAMLQPTDQMWREMLPQLRTFVRRRIADPDRADDLVAEILLRIHQNVGSLDDRERLPNRRVGGIRQRGGGWERFRK